LTWVQLVRGFNLNHKTDDKIWCLKIRLWRAFLILHRARVQYLETKANTSCLFKEYYWLLSTTRATQVKTLPGSREVGLMNQSWNNKSVIYPSKGTYVCIKL
jgi:hypothetical protein